MSINAKRIAKLEAEMLPMPEQTPAVTLITSAISGYAGLAEAKAQAEREGRPLVVINLVPAEFKHEQSEITPSTH